MPYNVSAIRNKNFIVGTPYSGLLDSVPSAVAAYSVGRKLRAGYLGNALQLREDAGNTLMDFGFNGSGAVDDAAIAAWKTSVGASNLYVARVYDQSGGGYDFVQAVDGAQPLYNTREVILDGTDDKLTASYSGGTASAFALVAKSGATGAQYVFSVPLDTNAIIQGFTSGKWEWYDTPRTVIGDVSTSVYQTIKFGGASLTNGTWKIGQAESGGSHWPGRWSEFIVWLTLSNPNLTTVASNQAAFYGY